MKTYYFIFQNGHCVLGPFNRLVEANAEAQDQELNGYAVRCFETRSKETAEEENKTLEN